MLYIIPGYHRLFIWKQINVENCTPGWPPRTVYLRTIFAPLAGWIQRDLQKLCWESRGPRVKGMEGNPRHSMYGFSLPEI